MLLGLILLLITLAGCTLWTFKPAWFPVPITTDAVSWDRHLTLTVFITGALFIAAQLLLAWIVIRARSRRSGGIASHRAAILSWSTAAAMIAIEVVLSVAGNGAIPRTPGKEEVIEVFARQFAWNFRYPGPDGKFGKTDPALINDASNPFGLVDGEPDGQDDIVATRLRIPANRDVLLRLHSRDVIHDFFVRELRTKQDVVPGMENVLHLRADRLGEFEIACAELCGIGHYQMHSSVIVLPEAEYEQWKRDPQ